MGSFHIWSTVFPAASNRFARMLTGSLAARLPPSPLHSGQQAGVVRDPIT